ncbi:MAG: hypothetical protein NW703_15720 [Nitrospiraceae bacterium]
MTRHQSYKTSPARNPTEPARCGSEVARGGSWYDMLYNLRSTNRTYLGPASAFFNLGFRYTQGHGR